MESSNQAIRVLVIFASNVKHSDTRNTRCIFRMLVIFAFPLMQITRKFPARELLTFYSNFFFSLSFSLSDPVGQYFLVYSTTSVYRPFRNKPYISSIPFCMCFQFGGSVRRWRTSVHIGWHPDATQLPVLTDQGRHTNTQRLDMNG